MKIYAVQSYISPVQKRARSYVGLPDENLSENSNSISGNNYGKTDVSYKYGINIHQYSGNYKPKTVTFLGHTVHIVDGGGHAANMEHFAHSLREDIDVEMHDVRTNKNDDNVKQLDSLAKQLHYLNNRDNFEGEFVAVPALATVGLLNLQDQYNKVMHKNIKFTPENIKSHKKEILNFLKKIYDSPDSYRKYINYMDPNKQGIEYTYGVIQEINKLIGKNARVYVPSGHPQDQTIKWIAAQKGLKPELYHYIATGKDKDGVIEGIHREIKNKNWYDFNLLSLSDANIVGVKGEKGSADYIFAAYDSCVNDGARGVYNFSPVRKDGQVIGYSYHDTITNEYPYEEFPGNHMVENLLKFVGKKEYKVIANSDEVRQLKKLKQIHCENKAADKLYRIDKIFTPEEIKAQKLDIQGKYVDRTLKLFFDVNKAGEIIFPKCDCEGTGKPSVLSMWGSCFSVFNAIARDIKLAELNDAGNVTEELHKKMLSKKIMQGLCAYVGIPDVDDIPGIEPDDELAVKYFDEAIKQDKAFAVTHSGYIMTPEPYYYLGCIYQERFPNGASGCYNNAINLIAKQIIKDGKDMAKVKSDYEKYNTINSEKLEYENKLLKYKHLPFYIRIITTAPKPSKDYKYYLNLYKDNHEYYEKNIVRIADMFDNLSSICQRRNEDDNAGICKAAAQDIKDFTPRGKSIIKLRSEGVQYIGDLYNED